ncbi:TPA: hypothetical protein EYP38_00440 [Candidatus Micrarchaeota archaeon]|nr:hypothetical protein [Candidatus Micrarchaeota archaeon]
MSSIAPNDFLIGIPRTGLNPIKRWAERIKSIPTIGIIVRAIAVWVINPSPAVIGPNSVVPIFDYIGIVVPNVNTQPIPFLDQ